MGFDLLDTLGNKHSSQHPLEPRWTCRDFGRRCQSLQLQTFLRRRIFIHHKRDSGVRCSRHLLRQCPGRIAAGHDQSISQGPQGLGDRRFVTGGNAQHVCHPAGHSCCRTEVITGLGGLHRQAQRLHGSRKGVFFSLQAMQLRSYLVQRLGRPGLVGPGLLQRGFRGGEGRRLGFRGVSLLVLPAALQFGNSGLCL